MCIKTNEKIIQTIKIPTIGVLMPNQFQGIDMDNKRIILKIISGYGFSLIKGSIVVQATLTKKTFQTPIISVSKNEVKFDSEIVWPMDIAELKKIKMSCASIRVECYHIPINKSKPNEKLGYILLKVKGAQTINPESNERIDSESYKLIGSKNNYSLNMSLRIEDAETMESMSQKLKNLKLINKDKNITDSNLEKVEINEYFNEKIEINIPQTDVNVSEDVSKRNEFPNVSSYDIQQKIIEELEDWKEKQMILFNEKMKIKEEQLLKEFNVKWSNDKKCLEEELIHNMSKCKALAENVDEMVDMLKEKEAIVTAKELELVNQKENMDNKYISLIQNLQTSNAQTINEFSNKIVELETKLHNSEKTNSLLKKENEQLRDDINSNCTLRIQELEKTILNLEHKCEEANKSCMFFKERWIASVRKMNQMYSKLHVTKSNHHLSHNKLNIQNILSNQLAERQHDEEKLKTLLDNLSKLRQDMTKTNYFDR